jgi:hypothetical protein
LGLGWDHELPKTGESVDPWIVDPRIRASVKYSRLTIAPRLGHADEGGRVMVYAKNDILVDPAFTRGPELASLLVAADEEVRGTHNCGQQQDNCCGGLLRTFRVVAGV